MSVKNDFLKVLEKSQETFHERKESGEDVGLFLVFKSYCFDDDDRYGETERIVCVNNPNEIIVEGEFIIFSYMVTHLKDRDAHLINESIRIKNLERIIVREFQNKELEEVNI